MVRYFKEVTMSRKFRVIQAESQEALEQRTSLANSSYFYGEKLALATPEAAKFQVFKL
jgi:hypothetical protein